MYLFYKEQASIPRHLINAHECNPITRFPLETCAPAPSRRFTHASSPSRYRPRFSLQVHLLIKSVKLVFPSFKHRHPLTDGREQVARWQQRKRARIHNSQVLGAKDPGFGVDDRVGVGSYAHCACKIGWLVSVQELRAEGLTGASGVISWSGVGEQPL